MGADGANAEPATQAYCEALLNQEKSLEELQKHLLKTEELFRESVKRKNQQLDLMQTELSRLKTSAPASDEVAPAHERALSELASEVERLRQRLAARDAEVDRLSTMLSAVNAELAEERAQHAGARERFEQAQSQLASARRDERLQHTV